MASQPFDLGSPLWQMNSPGACDLDWLLADSPLADDVLVCDTLTSGLNEAAAHPFAAPSCNPVTLFQDPPNMSSGCADDSAPLQCTPATEGDNLPSRMQDAGHNPHQIDLSADGKGIKSKARRNQPAVQIAKLAEQLDIVTAQFSQLNTENTTLKQRLQLLENLVPLRAQQAALVAGLPTHSIHASTQPTSASASIESAGDSSVLLDGKPVSQTCHDTSSMAPDASASCKGGVAGSCAIGHTSAATAAAGIAALTAAATAGVTAATAATAAFVSVPTLQAVPDQNDSDAAVSGSCGALSREPSARNSEAGSCSHNSSQSLPDQAMAAMPPIITLGELIQRAFPLSQPAAVNMTDAEFRSLHLNYQKATAILMSSWDTFPTAAVLKKIEDQVLNLLTKTILGVAITDPDVMFRNLYVNLETGERDFPGEHFWHAVARRMTFSKEQLKAMQVGMTEFENSMAQILAERQALAQMLDAHIRQDVAGASAHEKLQGHADVLADVAEQMEKNVERERVLQANLLDSLGYTVITVIQFARDSVSCYPYVPDSFAILKALLKLHKDEL